ncbi:MAG: hypothetical protein ACT4TC_04165 [Myxococcaceae bacterium]
MSARFLPLLVLPLAAGCIIDAPTGETPATRAKALVSNLPPVNIRNGAILDNKVEISGATLAPGKGAPGEPVKVTAYFRVLDDIDINYAVFVHVEDADGRVERSNVDHQPAGGPTRQWKKGETIKDEFTVFVPANASVRALNLFIGLWDPATDARMKVSNPEAVRHDGNNRVLLAQLPVVTM